MGLGHHAVTPSLPLPPATGPCRFSAGEARRPAARLEKKHNKCVVSLCSQTPRDTAECTDNCTSKALHRKRVCREGNLASRLLAKPPRKLRRRLRAFPGTRTGVCCLYSSDVSEVGAVVKRTFLKSIYRPTDATLQPARFTASDTQKRGEVGKTTAPQPCLGGGSRRTTSSRASPGHSWGGSSWFSRRDPALPGHSQGSQHPGRRPGLQRARRPPPPSPTS